MLLMLQQEVQRLISFIQKELVNVANKTELQNLISLISKLEDKIAKQKLDIQQLIDNIPDENEDTFQQELNALETKLNSELQKELTNIKKQIQNIDDSEIKTYIQQQIQNIDDSEIKNYIHQQIQNIDDSVIQQQITTINNLVLKQDKNILALEKKFLKKESYYFKLPFQNLSDEDVSITDNIDRSKGYEYKKYGFTRQNFLISNKRRLFNARKINDENTKVNHLYEIKTSGKYIDRFRMLIIPDNEEDFLTLSDFDMIMETETPPSMNIIRNPEPQTKDISSYQFLRATDFEYVKLYFVDNDIFTSIDIHKSQQKQTFLIRDDSYVNISISIKKPKFSVHLNKINDSKEQISLVTVKVVINKHLDALSEVHLI
ncbi:hypothetical protein LOTGIDRAFT_176105 [Lottia gigantea]|uniref:Uncharacterized protein n=1 Tax=Lottia gigantea TaxID=225164 RepID=V4B7L5_LOTGI|nr:hypothetical protein LOTGIDRAFT_176105 [Lottia gigantea]ESO84614.1 hypothetical protein LOTGIDRAFT_176105 [Lottia gigantea]